MSHFKIISAWYAKVIIALATGRQVYTKKMPSVQFNWVWTLCMQLTSAERYAPWCFSLVIVIMYMQYAWSHLLLMKSISAIVVEYDSK